MSFSHIIAIDLFLCVSGIHYFADVYSCSELEAMARQFIYQNFLDVIRMEEFFELPEERLIDLLKSDKLQVQTVNTADLGRFNSFLSDLY